ncbi:MAG TPA: PorV/PorQ family protein, partial [Bacteroidetes bacterium]|nr:PorV/PorQ family protein [Bacteroidota bacterium]
MRKIFVFLIILSGIFSFTGVYGQKPGTSGAEFLKLPAGARQAGIGGTFVGIGDDVNSLFWNPGGLATLKTWGFSAMHSEWLADLRFDSFGLAIPVFGRKNVVGAMAGILSMPSWDNTGGVEPAVSAQDLYAGVAFARNVWPKIYVGGAVKYIRRKLADFAAGAIAFDIGAIYKYSDWLTFGGSAQNYGGRIKFIKNAASLPFVLRGGASIRPFFGKPFDIIFAADGIYYLNEDIRQICLGSELNLFHLLNIRAGYRIDKTLLSMSSGLGIKYGMFNLDYAYNPFEKKISGFFHALST